MKKILMGVAALGMVAAFSACDKCADNSCAKTAVDSVSTVYGTYVGSMLNSELSQYQSPTKADKEAFLRGLQLVMGAKDDKNTRMGMQVALQMANELNQMSEQGINIDRVAVINNFKAAFLADSVDFGKLNAVNGQFRDLYQRAVEEAQAAKAAENAEETAAQAVADEEFVADFIAAHPGAQTAESGLTYFVEVEGEGDKPAADATVVVNYTGKHLDGSVFDSSEGRGPATFNLQGVVRGSREGLMLLGKGGKATLVMPANLAYGANGTPDGSIKPNETLMFDVELLDIK